MYWTIEHFETLESTNATGREWLAAGAREGVVIVARNQTAGRGRQGRSWATVPGALLCSLLLRPQTPPHLLPRIGFLACVAAARAAERLGLVRGWLKWPNDLVIAGGAGEPSWQKWGGILIESGVGAAGACWAVAGIGLNIGPLDSPAVPGFGSLSLALGEAVEPLEFLDQLLDQFGRLYDPVLERGWDAALEEWRSRDVLLGRRVLAETRQGPVEGTAAGIDSRGALLLDTGRGRVIVEAGDVHLKLQQ